MVNSNIGTEKNIIKAVALKTGYTEEIVADMYKAITLHFESLAWDPSATRIVLARDLGTMYVNFPMLSQLAYEDAPERAKTFKRQEYGEVCKAKKETLLKRGFVKTSFHFKTPTIESSFLRNRLSEREVADIQNKIYKESLNSKL